MGAWAKGSLLPTERQEEARKVGGAAGGGKAPGDWPHWPWWWGPKLGVSVEMKKPEATGLAGGRTGHGRAGV